MMIKKCDRCGCCYSPYDLTLKDGTIEKYSAGLRTDYYDLCPECIKEFERWIKNENKSN